MSTARQLEIQMRPSMSARMIEEFCALKRVLLVDMNSGLSYVRRLPQHDPLLVSLMCPDLLKIKKEQMNYYEEVIEGDITAPDLQRALQISQAETLVINIDRITDSQKEEIVSLLGSHPDYATIQIIIVSAQSLMDKHASNNNNKNGRRPGLFAKLRGSASNNATNSATNKLQDLDITENDGSSQFKVPPEQAFGVPEVITRTTIIQATTPAGAAAAAEQQQQREKGTNDSKNCTSNLRSSQSRFRFSRGKSLEVATTVIADEWSSLWTHKTDSTEDMADWINEEINDTRYQGCCITLGVRGMELLSLSHATEEERASRTTSRR